jgi:hypothetical protein
MDPAIQRIPGELLGHMSGAELAELIRLLEAARKPSMEISQPETIPQPES